MILINESTWQSPAITISALCVSFIAILTSLFLWKKSKVQQVQVSQSQCNKVALKPEKWVKVGTVKRLIIYPIKSCAGTVVEKGVITTLGLKGANQIV